MEWACFCYAVVSFQEAYQVKHLFKWTCPFLLESWLYPHRAVLCELPRCCFNGLFHSLLWTHWTKRSSVTWFISPAWSSSLLSSLSVIEACVAHMGLVHFFAQIYSRQLNKPTKDVPTHPDPNELTDGRFCSFRKYVVCCLCQDFFGQVSEGKKKWLWLKIELLK